jgi:hypothetical protein
MVVVVVVVMVVELECGWLEVSMMMVKESGKKGQSRERTGGEGM